VQVLAGPARLKPVAVQGYVSQAKPAQLRAPNGTIKQTAALMSDQGYETTGVVIMAQATDVVAPVKDTTRLVPQAALAFAGPGATELTGPPPLAAVTPPAATATTPPLATAAAPPLATAVTPPAVATVTPPLATAAAPPAVAAAIPRTANAVSNGEASMGKLRASIVGACGQLASGVNVQSKGTNKLVVQMKVQREADATELGPKVLALAELAPYEVELIVRLAK
jgi:hypothetical protein